MGLYKGLFEAIVTEFGGDEGYATTTKRLVEGKGFLPCEQLKIFFHSSQARSFKMGEFVPDWSKPLTQGHRPNEGGLIVADVWRQSTTKRGASYRATRWGYQYQFLKVADLMEQLPLYKLLTLRNGQWVKKSACRELSDLARNLPKGRQRQKLIAALYNTGAGPPPIRLQKLEDGKWTDMPRGVLGDLLSSRL